jgi:hypothetical protein
MAIVKAVGYEFGQIKIKKLGKGLRKNKRFYLACSKVLFFKVFDVKYHPG